MRVELKVLFDEVYWIGVVEVVDDNLLKVKKIIFKKEPSNEMIYQYVLHHQLLDNLSHGLKSEYKDKKINPKRLQRMIHRQVKDVKITKKSYEAMKQLQEENKDKRKSLKRKKVKEKQEYLYSLKRLKKKEKHKGR